MSDDLVCPWCGERGRVWSKRLDEFRCPPCQWPAGVREWRRTHIDQARVRLTRNDYRR